MSLTEIEKVSIKFHLGYPVQSALRSMVAGLPQTVESNWQIDTVLRDGVLEEQTIDLVRNVLSQLDGILFADFPDARLELKAEQLEELRMNMRHEAMLAQQYEMWQQRLAQILCVPVNPNMSGVGGAYTSVSNFSVTS